MVTDSKSSRIILSDQVQSNSSEGSTPVDTSVNPPLPQDPQIEIAQGGGEALAESGGAMTPHTDSELESPTDSHFPAMTSSGSLSSRASKMSASAMSVIAATMTTNVQVFK